MSAQAEIFALLRYFMLSNNKILRCSFYRISRVFKAFYDIISSISGTDLT